MKFIKENYERFFGTVPDKSAYGDPASIVKTLATLLASGARVLDLGAGDGRHSIYLAGIGCEVTAVDLSEAGIEKLERLAKNQNLNITSIHADLGQWDIDTDYDAIICINTLQHLRTESALKLLEEIQQRTKTGGFNALSVFTKTGDRFILDKIEDPNAFYADDGWLKEYYKNWEIIEFTSETSPLINKFRLDGSPMEATTEKFLVKKH